MSPCRLIVVALLLCSQSVVAEEQQHAAASSVATTAACSEDNSSTSSECSEESTTNKKLETIRLGLEWFTNPDHLPLIVAQKHGIFKSFGLDVQIIEPADHWEAEEEILAGRLDVAVTEPLHLAQDAARGKPVLGFTRFLHTDGGVLYDAGKGDIQRPADMCGKTISYPGR
jgi:ABC-type nitrate/sulfonate/bicarbonate transport system substrate-binding protein